MKKILFSVLITILIISAGNSFAQVTQAVIGVDGFTCSLCAKGVEEQFKSLEFVKSVKTDLKNTQFTLNFKTDQRLDISKIENAVVDGGFTVREIKITAKGELKGGEGSGFYLVTTNTPDLALSNIKGEFSNDEKVELKGSVNLSNNHIRVSSIKKY